VPGNHQECEQSEKRQARTEHEVRMRDLEE
jgi:hypothetical protein